MAFMIAQRGKVQLGLANLVGMPDLGDHGSNSRPSDQLGFGVSWVWHYCN